MGITGDSRFNTNFLDAPEEQQGIEASVAVFPRISLFCHITQNWRGRPLTDHSAVVELIGTTTTTAGLKVECAIDRRTYQKGVKVEDADFDAIHLSSATASTPNGTTLSTRAYVAVDEQSVLREARALS
jgi:Rhodopirellula transposase DDE domain